MPAQFNRRSMFRGVAATALLAGPLGAALAGCAAGGGGSSDSTGAKTPTNPFGVVDGDPLEVAAFNGGLGDGYIRNAESLFTQAFPKSQLSHQAIQDMKTTLQPRFASGNPPDLVDDSGDGQIPLDGLYSDGQLADLTPLLDAPSYDDPGKKVRDTLVAGTIDYGSFNGKMYELNYTSTLSGIWYSSSLFAQHGWEYPQTWDGFLQLCGTIKSSTGIYPWIHQGKYPDYMTTPILDLAYKAGGQDVLLGIDNLEPNAWRNPSVVAAVNAVYELVAQGYVYPGAEGLTHLESQTKWNQGQAAFIPCGTWLPNEQKAQTPAGFDMVLKPMPGLSSADKMPYGTLRVNAGEPFIVPAKAKNVAGGMEILRLMLSKKVAGAFAQTTQSLPSVLGAGDAVTGPTIKSENDAVKAAGPNTFAYQYMNWYADLHTATQNATGELMANRAKPADWVNTIQAAADKIAADSSIPKFHRTK